MNDRKQALLTAIQMEVMSQNFYSALAAAFSAQKDISSTFAGLIPIEAMHEDKITAIFRKEFPDAEIIIDRELLPKMPQVDIIDPQKVLEIAIVNEDKARDMFLKMAAQTTDPDTLSLLKTLAAEEENHKAVLQDEILRLANLMTWFDPSELNGLVED